MCYLTFHLRTAVTYTLTQQRSWPSSLVPPPLPYNSRGASVSLDPGISVPDCAPYLWALSCCWKHWPPAVTMGSFEEVGLGVGGKTGPSGSSPETPRSWACTPLASRAEQREEPGLRNWKPHSWITLPLLGTLGKMWSLGLFICKMGRSFRNLHLKVFMWPTNPLLFHSCFVPHPQSSLKNQNGSNKKSNCPDAP